MRAECVIPHFTQTQAHEHLGRRVRSLVFCGYVPARTSGTIVAFGAVERYKVNLVVGGMRWATVGAGLVQPR